MDRVSPAFQLRVAKIDLEVEVVVVAVVVAVDVGDGAVVRFYFGTFFSSLEYPINYDNISKVWNLSNFSLLTSLTFKGKLNDLKVVSNHFISNFL